MNSVKPSPDLHSQDETFAFMSDPRTHDSRDVRRIDTHAASVFLAGSRAFKIKRDVKFPFLDYSTLAKRKAACDQEIEINRPFASQIYRRAIAITRKLDGGLEIGGDGQPVEWAVEMNRFDENATFDRLAKIDRIDNPLAEQIADAIIATHNKAAISFRSTWIESIPSIIAANSAAFSGSFDRDAVADLNHSSLSAFHRIRNMLRDREREGFVRRCHGDLHLANIALIDRKPALFDAIEFDPAIATTDLLYDLAFTLMDLLHFDRKAVANTVLNRYLQNAPVDHLDGLASLPLFMSLRAAIRANVILARNSADASMREANRKSAAAYFSLARQLIVPVPAKLIAIGGLSGTGKSTVARKLAPSVGPLPGAIVVRSDILRKQHFHLAELDTLPADAYSPAVTELIYGQLVDRADRVLAQGHSVILDAVFARQNERDQACAVAKKHRVICDGFFLTADIETRLRRIAGRTKDASDATAQVALRQEHYDTGPIDWKIIDTATTSDEAIAKIRAMLDKSPPR
ncbi:MAG: AAA family ATPase [Xanthobacteraceae bacterium]|nr:AAA family ATPase [Xanthobacteraceae bacterium]